MNFGGHLRKEERFPFSPQLPNRLWSPSSLLSTGYRGTFCGSKAVGTWSYITLPNTSLWLLFIRRITFSFLNFMFLNSEAQIRRYHSIIFLEWLKEITENLMHGSRCSYWDSNRIPPEHKCIAIPLQKLARPYSISVKEHTDFDVKNWKLFLHLGLCRHVKL